MRHPVHVLEQGADVQEIVNMAAVAVIDAQSRTDGRRRSVPGNCRRTGERRPSTGYSKHGNADQARIGSA
jgi:hypothetical protein